MKRLLWLLMACLAFSVFRIDTSQADMLYLKNGDEYKGALEKMTGDTVSFRVEETNKIEEFPRSELLRIELSKKRAGAGITNLADLKDPLLSSLIESAPGVADYPDAGYLTLYEEVTITVHPDRSCTRTKRVIRKVLQRRGIRVADNIIGYLARDESVNIDFARTINQQGNIFHIADNAIETGSVYSRIPEYENLLRLKFALPEVKVGNVIDYQITRQKQKVSTLIPLLIEEYLRHAEPLLKKVVTIIVPKDFSLDSVVIRHNPRISFSTEETRDSRKYICRVIRAPRINKEPNMPPYSDIVPKLVAGLSTGWTAIGQKYLGTLKSNFKPSPEFKAKVNELIKDLKEPEARARALYNYVACEIRYIPVAPAEFSYLPKPLDRIFENKFGNSLDKAYLLYGMLKLAGFNPSFLWIRSQAKGELVEVILSLGQFTTPLVALEINGQTQYLNPSFDTVPFNTLLDKHQGVYGLLIKRKASQLIKTPLYEPAREAVQNNFEITLLANGDITVKKTIDLSGGYEIAKRRHKDLKPKELTKQFQEMVNRIHPNARLIDYDISDLRDLNQKVHFTLTYQIKDYATKAGAELLVFKIPEINYSAWTVGKKTREFPLDWDARTLSSNKATIIIPAGYKVYYLPENYSFKAPSLVSYQAQFEVKEQTIIFNDRYCCETISISPEKYSDYKKCLETMATLAKEWIILERTD